MRAKTVVYTIQEFAAMKTGKSIADLLRENPSYYLSFDDAGRRCICKNFPKLRPNNIDMKPQLVEN